ncbi:hypothetical protein AcV5_005250 [Taiwanofungus camphoratus]|nr:hypothetical protein AcV5_005250 [Antrodia cinnamomea]
MSSDSEEALWSHLSNSQEHAWQAAIEQDDVPSQADFFSAPSYRKKANTPKKVVKKSIVAGSRTSTSHPDKWSGKSSRVGHSIGQQLASMSSVSVQSNVTVDSDGYATAFGSDFEVLEVNSMNGTDNKSFSAATRRSTLSRSSSENTSTASLSSTSSSAESPHFGQKRTLEYTESFVWTSSPSSPSHKVRKVTKQVHNSSANPSTVDAQPPQTLRKPKFRPAVNFADACGSINPMVSASKHTAPPSTTSLQPSPSIGDPLPSSLASSATAYSHTTTQDSATKHEPSGSRQFLKNSLFSAARGLATSVLGTSSQDISTPIIPHKDSETFESVQTAAEQVSIIAHSSDVQRLMDLKRIAWGVQYELARGVCHGRWTWENVTSAKLDLLVGSNKAAAHLVAQVMLSSNNANKVAITELPLWTELDREEEAIIENRSRGLGLQGESFEDSNWYGGKITQIARLTKNEKGSAAPFRVLLERMEKRKSNRFARFLGSRRLLQVSISKDLMYAEQTQLVRDFICRKFILCGRVYVPFCAKDKKVFMMEINEDYERAANLNGDQYRMSLQSFVNWHNPLMLNGNQPTTKWSTRFQLGLSNSVPVLEFQGVGLDMFYIEDEVAPYAPSLKKAPTENIFTDGCGFMNGAALTLIGRRLGYSERPTAVQGRIGGAKGLWALHPEDRDPNTTPKVWTRSSQRKIKYNDATLGLAQRIFDLVAPPRITKPSRLSKHTIMNLSHNGVPSHIFISLMRECLQKEIEALTRWNTQHDMLLLWNAINQGFHVSTKKIYRRVTASLRALGVGGREIDRDDDEDNDGDDGGEDTLSGFTGRDEHSGQPDKAADTVLEMLQAGFHPLKLPILYDKLHTIIKMKIDDIIKDYKIVVPYSAEVFIIPDPFGVLEEGQIHFKSSQDLKDPLEDASPRTITGEVLIYRNPARLPSDVQKVGNFTVPPLRSIYVMHVGHCYKPSRFVRIHQCHCASCERFTFISKSAGRWRCRWSIRRLLHHF